MTLRCRILALFLCTAIAGFSADRVTISGNVVTTTGQTIDRATIIVYSAGVKKGYSTYCPTCYPDCGKRVFSDASGAFVIRGLNSDLRFRLLVVSQGYQPTFVPNVDSTSPAKAILQRRAPVEDPERIVLGRVVTPDGTPVRDATVETQGVAEPGGRQIFGSPEGLEPLAVTNEKGEFEIAYGRPATGMVLLVSGRGFAPSKLMAVPTGGSRQTIVLHDGALLSGRVLQGGKPVAGVEMALYSINNFNGNGYEEIRVGTKDDGTFAFTNVPTPVDWRLYAKMESIAARGAIQPGKVATRKDLEEVDVGDLRMSAGHKLRGKVILTDGKPVAEGLRLLLTPGCDSCGDEISFQLGSRSVLTRAYALRDSQTVLLPPDGEFEFAGLASGPYRLTAAVRNYGLATGYSLLRPKDAIDEEKWKRQAEFTDRYLRESNTIEVRIEEDTDNVVIRLEPKTTAR